MPYIIALALFILLAVVAYYSAKFKELEILNQEKQAKLELRDKIIQAMKRAVQNQAYLHGKLEEISNAKSAKELNDLYASIFK